MPKMLDYTQLLLEKDQTYVKKIIKTPNFLMQLDDRVHMHHMKGRL